MFPISPHFPGFSSSPRSLRHRIRWSSLQSTSLCFTPLRFQIFKDQSGKDLSSDLVSANRFREAAEQAKKELDSREMVSVEIPFITSDGDNFSYEFTREKFDDIIDDIVTRCVEPCKKCLKDAGIDRCTPPPGT